MLSEELLAADAKARCESIDPHRSILLQAPAGSGKTAVLTQRFLRLLCTVDDPNEILAITFTLKAAAEMRARVTRALTGATPPTDPGAAGLKELAEAALRHAAARGWNLLEDPGALRIQTIDAFNFALASQLPLAARAGGPLTLTETPLEIYRRAARHTLMAADTDAALGAALGLLFERLDNHWGTLERLLAQMLAQRGHWLRHVIDAAHEELCARIDASLADIVSASLAQLLALLPPALLARAQALPQLGELGGEPQHLPAWRRLKFLTLTQSGWRKSVSAHHLGGQFEPEAARRALRELIAALQQLPGFERLLRNAARLPADALGAEDRRLMAAASLVLRHAAAQLQTQFQEEGRIDYTYVSGAAREALAEAGLPTDLALRTGHRLRHILVDEFQDTSLAQFQLLGHLTAGWQQGDGRTLFVVGDPMQSIYRFRDAEVGLFISARERGIGGVRLEALQLTRNFRSTPSLVEWTNATFARVFPGADDLRTGAVAFSESVASVAARGDASQPVTLQLFPQDPQGEASAIAQAIRALRAQEPEASIAVLVFAHAHATRIVAALQRCRIESLGVDLVPLAQRPIVRDLVQLSRALHDLADRNAWLAVLRAPWCGATLATLSALSQADPAAPPLFAALSDAALLARLPEAESARVMRVREVLAAALARRDEQSAAEWLESTWVQLGAADAYPQADLEDAHAFFAALAGRAGSFEWQGPADFEALLADLFSAPRIESAHPVQIMTIHRAKGLEFDHVFLPALERTTRLNERSLLTWVDLPRPQGGSDLLMAPVSLSGLAGADEEGENLAALIGRFQRERDRHERARLLYVAATRARCSLHLSGAPEPRTNESLRPAARSPLESLWPALEEAFVLHPSTAGGPAPAPAASTLRRLIDSWRAPELPRAPRPPRLPIGASSLEPPEFSWVGETQRQIGIIVHALLARAAQGGAPPGQRFDAEGAGVLEQLRLHGVPRAERQSAAALIVSAVTRTLNDERGRWILGSHREAANELALTGLAAGRLQSVVIDRCFVDESGTRWVIDYKTSRHQGADLAGFLEQEMQRYRAQLHSYAALAQALGPEPVRAGLYFPLLGTFRELSL
jgi:ATP-dependent helicase/nuclease subunit A